ncbi:MAG: peptide chain release factor N(5)-glutamine methyltransferase [Holosporales bacterium]|nr:peptide chain release factor N(5)-glutamine methyltransferase [Holosporales bacterium]
MVILTKGDINSLSLRYGVSTRDALLLLSAVLKETYDALFFKQYINLSEADLEVWKSYLKRRGGEEPIAKIVQKKEFYGIEYKTNRHTMDPRPETELIIDLFKKYYKNFESDLSILDLGSGTGCLGLTVLSIYKNANCEFVDISEEALNITHENAINLNLLDRCAFTISDWFSNVKGCYDVIISNPPYVSMKFKLDRATLFDPKNSIYAKNDGMESYEKILPNAPAFLNKNGKLIIEIGFDQKEKIARLQTQLSLVEIVKDMSGIYRTCVFENV